MIKMKSVRLLLLLISLLSRSMLSVNSSTGRPELRDATYWHETDLEPDDVLAIMMLPAPKYVVVGEGNVGVKWERAHRYYSLLGGAPLILYGKSSNRPFQGDGEEFETTLPVHPHDSGAEKVDIEAYRKAYREFVGASNPVMVSLKPMRELFEWYREDQAEVTGLIGKVALYAYGGFNFRCLLSRTEDLSEKVCEFLNAFKRTVIYETYRATGVQNSMNRQNGEVIYKLLDESRELEYVRALLKLVKLWNQHLVKSFEDELESRSDPESKARNQKALNSIRGNEEFQFVVADFALAALMQSEVQPQYVKKFYIKDGYTGVELAPGGEKTKIATYVGLDFGLEGLIKVYIREALFKGIMTLTAASNERGSRL